MEPFSMQDVYERKRALEEEFVRHYSRRTFSWRFRRQVKKCWRLYEKYGQHLKVYRDDNLIYHLVIRGEDLPFTDLEKDAALERIYRRKLKLHRWRGVFRFLQTAAKAIFKVLRNLLSLPTSRSRK